MVFITRIETERDREIYIALVRVKNSTNCFGFAFKKSMIERARAII